MALRRCGAALASLTVTMAVLLPALRSEPRDAANARLSSPAAVARTALARLPLSFEPVRGGYVARANGARVFLGRSGPLLALSRGKGHGATVIRTAFSGAKRSSPRSELRLPGIVNEYRGSPKNWRTHIPTFGQVRYPGIYRGIDALFHGRGSSLEYDFLVGPGADPGQIGLDVRGARSVAVSRGGDLVIHAAGGTLRQARPVAYQIVSGHRVAVASRFRLHGRRVTFDVGRYDRTLPLTIDPVLSYASYLGGSSFDSAESIALGSDGTIYLAGATSSNDYPQTTSRIGSGRDDEDAVVTKLSADGSSILWANIVGGGGSGTSIDTANTTAIDEAHDIAVDDAGNAYVVGSTNSTDFATKPGAGAPLPANTPDDRISACDLADREAFLLKFSAVGAYQYGTCIGSSANDDGFGVAVRHSPSGDVYMAVAGKTTATATWGSPAIDGPQTTPGANGDAFLVEIKLHGAITEDCDRPGAGTGSAKCFTMSYRTFLGAGYGDWANSVAYDPSGNAYITGYAGGGATSPFPFTAGNTYGGYGDAFVAKLSTSTSGSNSLVYSRSIGTDSTEEGRAITVDSSGVAYIVGNTDNVDNGGGAAPLPFADTTGNLLRGGGTDGFIAQFDASGNPVHSTYVGGSGEDHLEDIAIQSSGSGLAEYVVGSTESSDITQHDPIDGQSCASAAAYNSQILVVKRVQGASPPGLVVSCLGGTGTGADDLGYGIAVPSDPLDGTMFVAGTSRGTFPTANAYQSTFGGGVDAVVGKVSQSPATITASPPALLGDAPAQFTFTTSDPDLGFACNAPDGSGHLTADGARSPASCGGTPGAVSYSGLPDGTHTFAVSTSDSFGSQSAAATHTFEVDRTPPAAFELGLPADGVSGVSAQPSFSWTASSDAHGLNYTLMVDGKPLSTVEPPSCVSGTCTARAGAPLLNGAHTWTIVAADGASPPNTQSPPTRRFAIGEPVTARFTIAPNPVLVGGKVTLDASASNDATHQIQHFEWDLDGDGTYETDGGATPSLLESFPTPGTLKIGLRVTDAIGFVGTSSQNLVVSAPVIPQQVGVSINKGAQYTNDPNVTLTVVAPPNTTGLLIANDGGFVGSLPQAVAKEVAWKLDSSGPERLPKTVYVRFLINTFSSSNYTDDIILDERPPVVDSASVVGAPPTTSAAAAAKLNTYKVKVKAHDSNSGVGGVQITTNKRKPGKLLKYAKKVTVKLAARPKFIRAKDRAGNLSPWKKLR